MGVFKNMEIALGSKLDTISGKPAIHWENGQVYIPVVGTRFWRPTNLPAGSQLMTASAVQKHIGIYQVDVFVPVEKGLSVLMADLDSIYSAYNTVLSLAGGSHNVDILGVGRGRVTREDAWLRGFISIEYMCYST